MLKYAWILENPNIEQEAYDKLSVQYFHLGKIKKSQEYHNRYLKGYIEPKESGIHSLTLLKHQHKMRDMEKIKPRETDYKHAVSYSKGFLAKIKDCLSQEEKSNLVLSCFNYEEGFKVRIPTPVSRMQLKDLPSPSTRAEDPKAKEIRKSLMKHELFRNKNASLSGVGPMIDDDYLRKNRKQREEISKKVQLLTSSTSPTRMTPTESPSPQKGKTIFINGREIILRNSINSGESTSLCQIFNQLNSQKQKCKDQEREQNLLKEIEASLSAFQAWITHEKGYVFLKVEKIFKGGRLVKTKRNYITRAT